VKRIFNLYAAPTDLETQNIRNYNDAVRILNKQKSLHGYNGECFENQFKWGGTLAHGEYQGGWFIPPLDILNRLHDHKDKHDLKGTFAKKGKTTSSEFCYFSCTPHSHVSTKVLSINFTNQRIYSNDKQDRDQTGRPYFFEPYKSRSDELETTKDNSITNQIFRVRPVRAELNLEA